MRILTVKAALLGVLFVLSFSAFWISLRAANPTLHFENGPMENFQVACLLFGIVCFAAASVRSASREEKIFYAALGLFYGTIVVLEVDTRSLGTPVLAMLTNGKIRDAWLGALWLAALLLFVRNAKPVWRFFLRWLPTATGELIVVAGGFWVLSGMIDKSVLIPKDLFAEELMEVNAAAFMLLAAALALAQPLGRRSHLSAPQEQPSQPHAGPYG